MRAKQAANAGNPAYGKILEAAKELFLANGFPATSMEMIARRADVVRATVYNNFADKEAILGELMRDYLEGYAAIPARVRKMAPPGQTSFELMEATIREAFMWRLENADLRPLIDISSHLALAGWVQANEDADIAIRGLMLRIHRQDSKRGLLRDGVDVTFATSALYGMIEAVLSSFDVHYKPRKVEAAVRQLALLHWYAIYRVLPDYRES